MSLREAVDLIAARGGPLPGPPPSRAAAIVAPPPITLRLAADLAREQKPTEFLVRGHIERGALVMFQGAPASAKSFLAQSIVAAIATGTSQWFGHATRTGPVVYLAGEGHRGVGRRLRAWSDHHGVALDDAPLFVSDRAFALNQAVDAHAAGDVIQQAADQCGMAPELIVFDTLARHNTGDENSSQDAGQLIANAAEMGARWGAAVLLVHHSGHGAGDRARGSSAFRGAVDCEYLATRAIDSGLITLRCMKAKDHDEPEPMAFELVGYALPWQRDDGSADTSAILRLAPGGVPAPTESGGPRKATGSNQVRALEVLRAMCSKLRYELVKAGEDAEQARVLVSEWRDSAAIPRNRWGEALDGLVSRRAVILDGPHARPSEP